jgi:hypothetical protein
VLTRALHAEQLGHVATDELVAATMRAKPELERDFREYTIRTRASGTNLVVFVCTKDGKYALFEDASWTPYVDKMAMVRDRVPTPGGTSPSIRRQGHHLHIGSPQGQGIGTLAM